MPTSEFDELLLARQSPSLTRALDELGLFLDVCRHAVARRAFAAAESLAWSASSEPLALSILLKGDVVWSVMRADGPGRWLVSRRGTAIHLTRSEAAADLARVLAALATMRDGVRLEWRSDGTIGGTF